MGKEKTSWVLSFLTGQLNTETLKNIIQSDSSDLDDVDFKLDDFDELWQKKTVQEGYSGDRKAFQKEYNVLSDEYKKFELAKSTRGLIKEFGEGGTILTSPDTSTDYSDSIRNTALNYKALKNPYKYKTISPGEGFDINPQTNSTFNPAGLSESEIAEQTGVRDENGVLRPVTFSDRFSVTGGLKVVYNTVTGKPELRAIEDGEDLQESIRQGITSGGYGLFGAQEKTADNNSFLGLAGISTKSFIYNGIWDTIMGTGTGATTAAKAINDFTNIDAVKPFLNSLDNQFRNNQYKDAENVENADWNSGTGAATILPSVIGQIGVMIGTGGLLSAAGISANAIGKSMTGALTLFGAADFRETALDYGLNPKVASMVWLGSLIGLNKVNQGVDYYWKYLSPDEQKGVIKKVVGEVMKESSEKLSGVVGAEAEVSKKFIDKLSNTVKNIAASKSGEGFVQESFQETGEELIAIGAEAASYHLKNVASVMGVDPSLLYSSGDVSSKGNKLYGDNFTWNNIASRLTSSFVYGGLGGAAGGLTNTRFKGNKESGYDGNILRFLAKDGLEGFDDNVAKFNETLDEMKDKGEVFSKNLGFDRLAKEGPSIVPLTDSNKNSVESLNDVFYKRLKNDLDTAVQTWKESGINSMQDDFSTLKNGTKDFEAYKLNELQHKLLKRYSQKAIVNKLLDLQDINSQIDSLIKERDANPSQEQKEGYYEALISGKGKKKFEKISKEKDGKTVEELKPLGSPKDILPGESLMDQKERILEEIKEIQSGKYNADAVRDVLLMTEVKKKTNGIVLDGTNVSQNYTTPLWEFNSPKKHDALKQYYNVTNTMNYSAQAEIRKQQKALSDFMVTYPTYIEDNKTIISGPIDFSLNFITNLNGKVLDKRTIQSIKTQFEPFKRDVAEFNRLLSKEDAGIISPEETTRLDELTPIVGDKFELVSLAEDTIRQAERVSVDAPQFSDEVTTTGLYTNAIDLEQGEKGEVVMMSSGTSLYSLIKSQENLARQQKEEYIEQDELEKILKDISLRRAQVLLNSTAVSKANRLQKDVLSVLLDESDPDLGSDKSIRAYQMKQALKETLELKVSDGVGTTTKVISSEDNTDVSKTKETTNFSELSPKLAKVIDSKLNDLQKRVEILIEIAAKNQPNLDSQRVKSDLQFINTKTDLIEKILSSLNTEDESFDRIRDLITQARTQVGEFFENGQVEDIINPKDSSKNVLASVVKKSDGSPYKLWELQSIMEKGAITSITEADALLSVYLNNNPATLNEFALSNFSNLDEYYDENSKQSNEGYVYLKTLQTINPYKFYDYYSMRMENVPNSTKVIPSYMQQQAIYQALALLESQDGKIEDGNYKDLKNQLFITGIQGSGKTSMVANMAVNIWSDINNGIVKTNPFQVEEGIDSVEFFDSMGLLREQKTGTDLQLTYVRKSEKKKGKRNRFNRFKLTDADKFLGKLRDNKWTVTEDQKKELKRIAGEELSFIYETEGTYPKNLKITIESKSGGFSGYEENSEAVRGKRNILAVSKYRDLADNLQNSIGSGIADTIQFEGDVDNDNGAAKLIELLDKGVSGISNLNSYDLIAFDEATLISPKDLETINKLLDAHNSVRQGKKLKIMYLGDTSQIGEEGALKPSRIKDGNWQKVKEINSFKVDRTVELNFNHRTGNKSISNLIDHYRKGRFKDTEARYVGTYYSNAAGIKGVQVVRQPEKDTVIKNFVEKYKNSSEWSKNSFVYVVNNNTSDEDIDTLANKYNLTTSVIKHSDAVQGKKFDYVIADLEMPLKTSDKGLSATFEYLESINEFNLQAQAVSVLGRAQAFTMFITTEEEVTSKEERRLSDDFAIKEKSPSEVKYHKKFIKELTKDKVPLDIIEEPVLASPDVTESSFDLSESNSLIGTELKPYINFKEIGSKIVLLLNSNEIWSTETYDISKEKIQDVLASIKLLEVEAGMTYPETSMTVLETELPDAESIITENLRKDTFMVNLGDAVNPDFQISTVLDAISFMEAGVKRTFVLTNHSQGIKTTELTEIAREGVPIFTGMQDDVSKFTILGDNFGLVAIKKDSDGFKIQNINSFTNDNKIEFVPANPDILQDMSKNKADSDFIYCET